MANHKIDITVTPGSPNDYGGADLKKVKSKDKISWRCNYPFAVHFLNDDSPFDTNYPILSGPKNKWVQCPNPVKAAVNVESYKYSVAAFTDGSPSVEVDDPIIIIDNDGGDGGGGGGRIQRRWSKKKKAAKK